MELNEDDGHWRVTVDTPDDEIYSFHLNLCFHFSSGIYHYQFKVVTESWFEQELEPALPENKYDEDKIEDREDNSYAINKEQLQFYKDAIQLRKSNAALTSPNFEFIFEDENNFILAWHRRISSTPDTH
ncbi:unnamed protein product [Rotaria magnacalcarata]|uniref:Uncharacterized protein n=1 Tax=Rotaria magnacalcarata TaxID=392030 RepID=A0A816GCM1_9BILA|nr:unnamed protein product [Rotaria magnacalcarata]CAF1673451.1 unnamed protein product [Rotaria magnacalcarata]